MLYHISENLLSPDSRMDVFLPNKNIYRIYHTRLLICVLFLYICEVRLSHGQKFCHPVHVEFIFP